MWDLIIDIASWVLIIGGCGFHPYRYFWAVAIRRFLVADACGFRLRIGRCVFIIGGDGVASGLCFGDIKAGRYRRVFIHHGGRARPTRLPMPRLSVIKNPRIKRTHPHEHALHEYSVICHDGFATAIAIVRMNKLFAVVMLSGVFFPAGRHVIYRAGRGRCGVHRGGGGRGNFHRFNARHNRAGPAITKTKPSARGFCL